MLLLRNLKGKENQPSWKLNYKCIWRIKNYEKTSEEIIQNCEINLRTAFTFDWFDIVCKEMGKSGFGHLLVHSQNDYTIKIESLFTKSKQRFWYDLIAIPHSTTITRNDDITLITFTVQNLNCELKCEISWWRLNCPSPPGFMDMRGFWRLREAINFGGVWSQSS